MEDIIQFLEASKLQYFATVGLDGKPKVRPFQMMYNDGGRLVYCTGANKEVYRELEENPNIEVCVSTLNAWLRIQGKVKWLEDIAVKEKVLSLSPLVKSIYHRADNPVLKAFYVEDAEAVLMSFDAKTPKVAKLC